MNNANKQRQKSVLGEIANPHQDRPRSGVVLGEVYVVEEVFEGLQISTSISR